MRDHKGLNEIARIIRRDIVSMIHRAKSGHPGGSLSVVEILTALYFDEMNVDSSNPKMEDRDRFVLSKGHAAPALYATLAEKGYFDKEELNGLRKIGRMLQGHPDMKGTPGVEISTGSLGQGFSAACGMAMASKLDNAPWNVYTLLGDGEVQEGIVWEAAMSAAHYKLDNLIAFLDNNGLQIDGNIESVMNLGSIVDKFKAFGWNVIEIDGHDFDQIFAALDIAKSTVKKPTMIVAKTIKGKGISFMENQAGWHGTAPNDAELEQALLELGGADNE
ncbi:MULTISPECIES: transketolase [unclassified Clostridioides]|uniref:transketolase n=1 Tax=unclassified Clostridioides TaxID=2635829 RepID=UPI001D0CD9F4|nr:transketolase [Clostridioides sp. ES-S-0001-02]MCC0641435.1 transketolase [Clostridioides sp. ES-S-0049-03]MCC0648617.1 transketolase [Clostridioides sp. ZZV15-6598]MCC0654383.1 transketolase [Clostridioides sp. ES-S-0001-03]MCC0658269.1 transketolase [Clostridioides sp. ES-S-0123-01]MCC0671700.1 transketolase [Clostridioides sp. ES-S-0145-01]MCC0677651.1 transketolase [Clostridioides sp. ES-W-0018-02]MCC0682437.1 transketolase [Clostridioides sp. ES-S-0005-03]MCC0696546.1 transketolase 